MATRKIFANQEFQPSASLVNPKVHVITDLSQHSGSVGQLVTYSANLYFHDGSNWFTLIESNYSGNLTGAPNFDPSSGNVPFTVGSGHTGRVDNLNADYLDGYDTSTTATSSAIPVYGSGGVLNVGTPTGDTHAATKLYVDNAIQGLDIKPSVAAATTASITLSGNQTIDGVSITAGMRVLVKDQSTASENGIYVSSASAWGLAEDSDSGSLSDGAYVFVENGTTQNNTGWTYVNDGAYTWVQFSGAGQITAGDGLTKTGDTLNASVASPLSISNDQITIADAAISGVKLDSGIAGDGLAFTTGVLSVNVSAPLSISADTLSIADGAIGGAKLNTAIAGDGLGISAGVLSVNVAGPISIVNDDLTIADGAITGVKLNSAIAGNGIGFGSGVMSVNVTGPITIVNDLVTIQDGALTGAKLADNTVTSTQLANSITVTDLLVQDLSLATVIVGSTGGAGAELILDGAANGDGTGGDVAYIKMTSGDDLHIVNQKTAGTMLFATGSVTRATIAADGKVKLFQNTGIGGDPSSTYTLYAYGNSKIGGTLEVSTPTANAHAATKAYVDGAITSATPSVALPISYNASSEITIADGAIGGAKLNTAIAGNGLAISAGVLSVGVASPISIVSDQLTIADQAITGAKLANNTVTSTQIADNLLLDWVRLSDFLEIRADDAQLYFENASNNRYWRQQIVANSTQYDFKFDYYNGTSTSDVLTLQNDGNIKVHNQLHLGSSSNFKIFHDGSNAYVQNTSGNLILKNTSTDYAKFLIATGGVELFYNGSKKFETISDGVKVIDKLGVGGTPVSVLSLVSGSRTLDFELKDTPASGDQGIQLIGGSGDSIGIAAGGTGPGLVLDTSNRLGIRTDSMSTQDSTADDLVIGDGLGHYGITLYSAATYKGTIAFGDPNSNYQGAIVYDHNNDSLALFTGGTSRLSIDSSGNGSVTGTFSAATPTATGHLATKGYVDSSITNSAAAVAAPVSYNASNQITIADGALTGAKLANNTVTSTQLADTIQVSSLGIGVSPSYPLDLGTGGTGNHIRARRIWASGAGTDSGFTLDNTLIYKDSGGKFVITNPGSYPNSAFSIDTSGNTQVHNKLGVGVSPSGLLHLKDDNGILTYWEADRGANANHYIANLYGKWGSNNVALISFRTGTDTVNKDDGRINFYTSQSGGSFGTPALTIRESQCVGIGTDDPGSYKLYVNHNSTPVAKFQGATNAYCDFTDGTINYRVQVSGDAYIGTTTNHKLHFKTNGSTRATIDTSGYLGLSNTSPQALLHVGSGNFPNPGSGYDQAHFGGLSFLFRNNRDVYLTSNSYFATTGWLTKYNGYAPLRHVMLDGRYEWHIGSGTTAGSGSGFTEYMRLTSTGLGINCQPAEALDVNGFVRSRVSGFYAGRADTAAASFGSGVPTILLRGSSSNTSYSARAGALWFQRYDGTDTAALYSTDGTDGYGLVLAAYQGDIKFATSTLGGTKMTISSAGDVGIGSAPSYKLHVYTSSATATVAAIIRGTQGYSSMTYDMGQPYLRIGGGEYGGVGYYQGIGFGYGYGGSYQPGEIAYETRNTGGYTYGDFVFGTRSVTTNTKPTQRMRIAHDGKIEIGNNIPMWSGSYGGALLLKGNNATSDRYAQLAIVDSTGSVVNNGLILSNSGDVGINYSPNNYANKATLSMNGTWGGKIEHLVSGTVKSDWEWSTGGLTVFGTKVSEALQFKTNNTGRFLIDASGNVRIGSGTASPASMLTLTGTTPYIRLERSGVPTWEIRQNYASSEYGFQIANVTESTIPFFVGNSGNVGINTTSPGTRLEVNGIVTIDTDWQPSQGVGGLGLGDYNTGGYKWIQSYSSHPLCINPLGNYVGVGTASPSHALDVAGAINTSSSYKLSGNNVVAKRQFVVSLPTGSGYSSNYFYPVHFLMGYTSIGSIDNTYVSVRMGSQSGSASYNAHNMYGWIVGAGWSDHPSYCDVYHTYYDSNERSILGVYRGTQNSFGPVVYLRGGLTYYITTTADTVNYSASAYTSGNATFAVKNADGSDYSGTSANISRLFDTYNSDAGRLMPNNVFVNGNMSVGSTSIGGKLYVKSYQANGTYYRADSANGRVAYIDDVGNTGRLGIGYAGYTQISFGGGANNYINNSYGLAIGSTDPGSYKLYVNGTSYYANNIHAYGVKLNYSTSEIYWPHTSGNNSSRSWNIIGEQGSYGKLSIKRSALSSATVDTEVLNFYNDSSAIFTGSVGVGNANPGTTGLRVSNGSSGQEIFKADDGATAVIRAKVDGTVSFEKGSVGIGSANLISSSKLDVRGTTHSQSFNLSKSGSSIGAAIELTNQAGDANSNDLTISAAHSTNSVVLRAAQKIEFYTFASGSWTHRVGISSAGSLGINCTPNNSYKLDVNGNARLSANTYIGNDGRYMGANSSGRFAFISNYGYFIAGADNASWCHMLTDRPGFYFDKKLTTGGNKFESYNSDLYINASSASNHKIIFQSGGASYAAMDATGKWGLGTVSPTQQLHVVGKALITDDIQLTGSNPRIDYNSNGSSALRIYDTTNATERARFDTSGNFGINTVTPTAKLHVAGTAKITDTLDVSAISVNGTTTANAYLGTNSSGTLEWKSASSDKFVSSVDVGGFVDTQNTDWMNINVYLTYSTGGTINDSHTITLTGMTCPTACGTGS